MVQRRNNAYYGRLCSVIAGAFFCSGTCGMLGCTIHEESRWGQAQDWITHLLALMAYGSALAFVCMFVAGIIFFGSTRN